MWVCAFPGQDGDHTARADLQKNTKSSCGLLVLSLDQYGQKAPQMVPKYLETVFSKGSNLSVCNPERQQQGLMDDDDEREAALFWLTLFYLIVAWTL